MKRLFAGVVLAAVLAAVPAMAASPLPIPYSWTGCYLGGNAGFAAAHNDWFDPLAGIDNGENNSSGAVAGGQIGCDYQAGAFVFGAQANFDWANLKGSHLYTGDPRYTDSNRASWLATLTGRVGYAVRPAALVYLKGGAAFVRNTFTEDCDVSLGAGCPGQATATRAGWTAGGGLEYRLAPMWSVFFEYDYMDLGRRTSTLVYTDATLYDYTIRQTTQMLLLGINYRFGGLH
ncbi:MAG TPA: outer membrane beta-barrel protein [Pseudolabrys sp.]